MPCCIARNLFVCVCLISVQAPAQDGKSSPAMADSAAVKMKIMDQANVMAAKQGLMEDTHTTASMLAMELMTQEVMSNEANKRMLGQASMADEGHSFESMMPESMMMAKEQFATDELLIRRLLQEMVVRLIAGKKRALMMEQGGGKGNPIGMISLDEESMMARKRELLKLESTAIDMVKETLIRALMKDPEVVALLEKEAKLQDDPSMAELLSDKEMRIKAKSMEKDQKVMGAMIDTALMRSMSSPTEMPAKNSSPK